MLLGSWREQQSLEKASLSRHKVESDLEGRVAATAAAAAAAAAAGDLGREDSPHRVEQT